MISDINKRRYINFHNGFWVFRLKNKTISRHKDINEAFEARNNYIREHPELVLAYKDKVDLTFGLLEKDCKKNIKK